MTDKQIRRNIIEAMKKDPTPLTACEKIGREPQTIGGITLTPATGTLTDGKLTREARGSKYTINGRQYFVAYEQSIMKFADGNTGRFITKGSFPYDMSAEKLVAIINKVDAAYAAYLNK